MKTLKNIIILCAVILLPISCGSLASKTKVLMPDVVPSIKKVAIWPIKIYPAEREFSDDSARVESAYAEDPLFQEVTDYFSADAEHLLVSELKAADLFSLITPDSVASAVFNYTGIDIRLSSERQSLLNKVDADAVLFTDLYFKSGMHGSNAYITLSIYDSRSGELVVVSRFNTMWGKSYLTLPTADKTYPDAIEGSVNGLKKTLRKHREER